MVQKGMVMVLRYVDLTQVQKGLICNGCGGKGSIIPVPNFLFKASCNQHDFYYWRGCTEDAREAADDAFYKYMNIDVAESGKSLLVKVWYYSWAYVYYKFVRKLGGSYFHYSKMMRTLEDL